MQRIRVSTVSTVLAVACALLTALPAAGVLIASGDGTGNTTSPADDPGFRHVGVVNGLTGIYLGNGWVLTANHVGSGNMTLQGVTHPAVAASSVRLQYGPGVPTDLRLFRLVTDPGLEPLEVAAAAPVAGSSIVMVGNGRNRGGAVSWQGIAGFAWGSGGALRWGTNRVAETGLEIALGDSTVASFSAVFDSGLPTPHEAIAATGDSGGAAFLKRAAGWELAGVLYAIYGYSGQPASTALYGDGTLMADLSFYRSQILAITAGRACSNGIDDDGDGKVDTADPGCFDSTDAFETNALVACDDGFDSDGDGRIDWPDDPGCAGPEGLVEDPACDDGVDNDGDGKIDTDGGGAGGSADPQCVTSWKDSEDLSASCGLGVELALLLPLLEGLRRPARRGRRREPVRG